MNPTTLYLIDGHSLTFKAYYAIRNLTDPQGRPTGAVFGFLRMLLKFIDDYQPRHLAVLFDTGKPTFRKELYDAYKANREAPPEDFGQQMEWVYRLLRSMGIAVYEREGFEADDLLATMAHAIVGEGGEAVILSADKDLFQLVGPSVRMLRPGQNDLTMYDEAGVQARLGIRPDQVADWLALVGDSSDNIPGVPGIGEKGATALLQQFDSLENLLARAAEVPKPKQREALLANADRARLARKLATVRRDVAFAWNLEACGMPANLWNDDSVRFMRELGFQSILRERGVKESETNKPAPARATAASQEDMFGAAGQGDGVSTETLREAMPSREAIASRYRAIIDEEELRAWVTEAMQAEWLAYDTETTSVDALTGELVGLSFCHDPGDAIYIPVGHEPHVAGDDQLPLARVRELLAPLLAGEGPRLSAHHAKFDMKVLRCAGFKVVAPAFDTMIASYLLNPDKPNGHGLKTLGRELCGIEMIPISELIGSGARSITMAQVPIADAADYAARDADVTLRLTSLLSQRLAEIPELDRLNREMELPLVSVLMEMELGGFAVDVEVLRVLGEELKRQLGDLSRRIWEEAGHTFNIGSSRQVAQILFEELGLKPGRKGKTGYSTDEAELERLAPAHPVPRLILEYRGYEKLQSTYIDALPRLVNPRTGRIHTSFNQTIAATGRLSSTDPNLQNIPIRTEMGRAIRRAFIADYPGHQVLKADYSQIELRILAHVTQDEALCGAYHEGRDIHRQTACEIFSVAPEALTPDMRAMAKVVNFSIVYGTSAHGLAQRLGISRTEAAQYIDRYFNTYPGVRAWIDRLLAEARHRGWVETLTGRRRLIPDLNARNGQLRANAERIAVNTPIQGTCADMIKLAMIRIQRELGDVAPGARMVCQVHDELVFSVPPDQVAAATEYVTRAMSEALPLSVPVIAEASHAANWAEC